MGKYTHFEDLCITPVNMIFKYLCREQLTVGVENASHSHVYTILSLEPVRQSFGDALSFVVTSTGSNRVDVAPAKYSIND